MVTGMVRLFSTAVFYDGVFRVIDVSFSPEERQSYAAGLCDAAAHLGHRATTYSLPDEVEEMRRVEGDGAATALEAWANCYRPGASP